MHSWQRGYRCFESDYHVRKQSGLSTQFCTKWRKPSAGLNVPTAVPVLN